MPDHWMHEFDPSYAVPECILAAQVEGLEDVSWHNDVCPSFEIRLPDEEAQLRLWVEHPDPDQREAMETRFCITYYHWLHDNCPPEWPEDGALFETNDETLVMPAYIRLLKEYRAWKH